MCVSQELINNIGHLMSEAKIFTTLELPPSASNLDGPTEIRCEPSMVIIGANGAGKTRIGTWLEVTGPSKKRSHRIPAQRSLIFPRSASPIGMQSAQDQFSYGERPSNWSEDEWENNRHNRRLNVRYGNVDPNSIATAPLSDFDKLMVLLFSENYTSLIEFDSENEATDKKVASPQSKIKKVKRVWESVLLHRKLEYKSGEVTARPLYEGSAPYLASGMSDGERVAFYLIAQCLCAPENSLIIIDEPELHLHRSIQKRLWDAIEVERKDCQFVYITHDLTFAEERTDASKIWLKSSTQNSFDWIKLEPVNGMPEDLLLEVLGSRQPVIFTEGTLGSIDFDVYSAVYSNFLVKPVGSCATVVQVVKAFRDVKGFHHLASYGLVDRDYLTDGQLASYNKSGIGSPQVAEIENIFLVPEVLEIMALRLGVGEENIEKVYSHIYAEFGKQLKDHALSLTQRDVILALGRFSGKKTSATDLDSEFKALVQSIDIPSIYNQYLTEGQTLLDNKNYMGILKVFNEKDLVARVSSFFGVTKPNYLERTRKMTRDRDEKLILALSRYLPILKNLC